MVLSLLVPVAADTSPNTSASAVTGAQGWSNTRCSVSAPSCAAIDAAVSLGRLLMPTCSMVSSSSAGLACKPSAGASSISRRVPARKVRTVLWPSIRSARHSAASIIKAA
ncbi:hypothetical protein D3C87_1344160 [compost metagenome]